MRDFFVTKYRSNMKIDISDIVTKILCDIAIKNDSGNKVMSLLSSLNSRFHCGKNILWKIWKDAVKSNNVDNTSNIMRDKDIIDQRYIHLKIRLYLRRYIEHAMIITNKINDAINMEWTIKKMFFTSCIWLISNGVKWELRWDLFCKKL